MKSTTAFLILSVYFLPHLFVVESLECRYCRSEDYNSDCRLGTEETLRTCTIEGEDHCYEEYIIPGEKKNGDYVPLYRRGCAPANWCTSQQNLHTNSLKFCKVCQGDKCNDDPFGAANSSILECHACYSSMEEGACRYGYTCDFSITCPAGSTRCVEEYVVRGPFAYSPRYKSFWKRGCGKEDFCAREGSRWGNALVDCRVCKRDLCNTGAFPNDW